MIKLNSPLARWLKTQDKEFVSEILACEDILGDGDMTIDRLRELDERYTNNPED